MILKEWRYSRFLYRVKKVVKFNFFLFLTRTNFPVKNQLSKKKLLAIFPWLRVDTTLFSGVSLFVFGGIPFRVSAPILTMFSTNVEQYEHVAGKKRKWKVCDGDTVANWKQNFQINLAIMWKYIRI